MGDESNIGYIYIYISGPLNNIIYVYSFMINKSIYTLLIHIMYVYCYINIKRFLIKS